MWLWTKYGFVSVVCAHQGHAKPPVPDPSRVMIRARNREHLLALRKRFTGLGKIVSNAGTDYPHRIICDKAEWVKIAAALASEINCCNFKDECHPIRPNDGAYQHALHQVWAEMRKLDSRPVGSF